MSTTLDVPQPPEKVEPTDRRTVPPATAFGTLEDHVPRALRFPRVLAGFVALVGAVFWIYSYQRLHHTDLWGHLAYGRLLCATRALPATEPLMPLSQGMPFVDTAWLAQVA